MKQHGLLLALALLGMGTAAADQAPQPPARALGIAEAVVSYCSKVDPAALAQYQAMVKAVAPDASDQALAKLRQSEDYVKAHASVDDFVAKVDEHNAKKVCTESLARLR
jgi:hypothetical protein